MNKKRNVRSTFQEKFFQLLLNIFLLFQNNPNSPRLSPIFNWDPVGLFLHGRCRSKDRLFNAIVDTILAGSSIMLRGKNEKSYYFIFV